MKDFRELSSLTFEEAKILVDKCFGGELLNILHLDNERVRMEIKTSGWELEDEENPNGEMVDEVEFVVGVYSPFNRLVELPFSGNGEEEKWQHFMIYHGFHPYYNYNIFDKGDD